ncbi:MAG: hypothetical protein M0Z90_04505 [Desulfobacteraceae bacterium]|nr:hypothetical protein [Desulfobacteraceae bacterium]
MALVDDVERTMSEIVDNPHTYHLIGETDFHNKIHHQGTPPHEHHLSQGLSGSAG